tara:strand:- start:85 stop:423 length:339 start_codon:yes stop_codon:yes gene_type:complete
MFWSQVIIRRIGGVCRAAFRAGGLEAAEHAEPYFTAHVYSLDDMKPTVPRMDLPNPFVAPAGRGWGDKLVRFFLFLAIFWQFLAIFCQFLAMVCMGNSTDALCFVYRRGPRT